jgi:hypothetical protein
MSPHVTARTTMNVGHLSSIDPMVTATADADSPR